MSARDRESGTHYFSPSPTVASSPDRVDLLLPDLTRSMRTDRGVFAGGALDTGTRLLLLEAPPPSAEVGTALDLGCGYGPIAVTLAHRAPAAAVWAVDVNRRALELCRANADDDAPAVAARIHTAEPDAVPDDLRFDLIWSNPPIRIGKAALHDLLGHWLDRLAVDGKAVLVVQRHLGADSLARWLDRQGWPTERLRSRNGYRLLQVLPRSADQPGDRP